MLRFMGSQRIGHNSATELTNRRRREKKKGYEKFFEDFIVENFPDMEMETVNEAQEAQSPIQDKPKEKHAQTHITQTNKDQTQ